MCIDLIDDDFQAECVRSTQECVEVFERAKCRIDIAIIGHIISEVPHGGCKEGRYPDTVHAEGGHMVQPLRYAVQIANAIPIRILIRPRINLIDDRTLPPRLRAFQ